ncbi:NAD(P)-binding Rossmann-fold containing protein [Glarea lozoyensis ATCC 20868]|uniref:NAD(P)-binding Rossmann-fold containing protein n=1 Tax=Glarea lozoyensis (strain ATCC 20868 / MF5171) TaxID=1116229 RepID=S3CCT2_GLAL2|nr:NAD(P)-binding Rossmann-fold containing protein [Glarea lozoyensis ATCC 20868]EPE24337.1 NAD(P)-binding Rossmann-fold containing protein [Glarea lozoyensis ATCC 20868]
MSSTSVPKTTKSWTVQGSDGFESLKFSKDTPIPEISDYEVLASTSNFQTAENTRMYPFAQKDGVVPCSDGAGEVVAVGSKVSRFEKGAKVLTLFNQGHLGGSLDPLTVTSGVGGVVDGTLRQYGAFNENGLVHMPPSLNWLEASTLSCAALTAWNSLYGLKPLQPGQVVLTQGTGGVSIFALQFAKAAGAVVISTTSSAKKAETLKKLGADHVLNYKDDPEWGAKAKDLTPGKEGVDHILEVGGPTTMKQSLDAIKIDGVISIIGFLGGVKSEKQPSFLDALNHICTIRGVLVGNRVQFEDMNRAIEGNKIKPVVDEKVFTLEEAKEAYQYMWDQKHFGKLTIKIE